jgi:hypothetical protein
MKITQVFLTFCFFLFLVGCQKESNISGLDNSDIDFRNANPNSPRSINPFVSTDSRHDLVAKTISLFFKSQDVRTSFDAYTRNTRGIDVVLLADYFYHVVIQSSSLISLYETAAVSTNSLSLCELLNEYFYDYPGIEIYFDTDSDVDTDFPDIINESDFETITVFDDMDTSYPIYKNGIQSGNWDVNDEKEDITIIFLQTTDVYNVYNTSNVTTANSSHKFSDLVVCDDLRIHLNNVPIKANDSTSISGCVIQYPLGGVRVVEIDEIFLFFNENCFTQIDTLSLVDFDEEDLDLRMPLCEVADRDALRNGNEYIFDVRGKNKDVLRDCDKWCARSNKNCRFQVDVLIPIVASATEWAIQGSLMKTFSLNEKRLRKGWDTKEQIAITPWLYLEGRHGDVWQYTWTGRHRKRGTVTETTINFGISGGVKFKLDSLEVTLNFNSSWNRKITRANEDCDLGQDFAYYCEDLPEKQTIGDIKYKLKEE